MSLDKYEFKGRDLYGKLILRMLGDSLAGVSLYLGINGEVSILHRDIPDSIENLTMVSVFISLGIFMGINSYLRHIKTIQIEDKFKQCRKNKRKSRSKR